jgi:alpha-galactosidase
MKQTQNRRIGWKRRLTAFGIQLIVCLAAATSTPTLAQADLTGYSVLRIPSGDGTFRGTFLDLKQTGEKVAGKVLWGFRELPIDEGSFRDGKLHLVVTLDFGRKERRVTCDRTLQGEKISMTVNFPSRPSLAGAAERTTREATLPALSLPLPALHALPDNGLVRTPPMGGNCWNNFAGKVDDAVVRTIADAMVQLA